MLIIFLEHIIIILIFYLSYMILFRVLTKLYYNQNIMKEKFNMEKQHLQDFFTKPAENDIENQLKYIKQYQDFIVKIPISWRFINLIIMIIIILVLSKLFVLYKMPYYVDLFVVFLILLFNYLFNRNKKK